MKENESALYSNYIIDGIRCDMTPAEILDECMEYSENGMNGMEEFGTFEDIIDESTEPPLSSFRYDSAAHDSYIARLSEAVADERPFTMLYPEQFTKLQIAKALISRLWSKGHFKLGDLRIWAQWEWNTRPIGNMAAFYASANAAGSYIYGLGARMIDYLFIESDETSSAKFFAWLPEDNSTLFKSSPYESHHPWIEECRKCSSSIVPDEDSWIIYIPFDTCPYRLGGSLLAQTDGHNGGPSPQIQDPDYFIDCYEVVRELVEDGIIMAGATVCDGGVATAAAGMCKECGMELDFSGVASSYQEQDMTKILFSEIPGVLIQVSDNDYDYIDSQFLLQDIAYYPVGHPCKDIDTVKFMSQGKGGVAGILASLLGQASEGED